MDIDWRPLFDSLRIPWKDRGSNTSKDNVNICCPWCVDDRGFHLSISETKPAYYCYRRPNEHSGTNQVRLVTSLGLSRPEAIRTLNAYLSRHAFTKPEPEAVPRQTPVVDLWSNFGPASESEAVLDYLEDRGFLDVVYVAQRFDLRVAPHTDWKWKHRVLLPISLDGEMLSWAGRGISGHITPKYRVEAEGDTAKGLIYVPDDLPFAQMGGHGVIVEGHLDALKIAATASNGCLPGVGAVALTGKALGPTKLLRLGALLSGCSRVSVALDNDAALSEFMGSIRSLTMLGMGLDVPIGRLRPPEGFKDAGEMSYRDIEQWLGSR